MVGDGGVVTAWVACGGARYHPARGAEGGIADSGHQAGRLAQLHSEHQMAAVFRAVGNGIREPCGAAVNEGGAVKGIGEPVNYVQGWLGVVIYYDQVKLHRCSGAALDDYLHRADEVDAECFLGHFMDAVVQHLQGDGDWVHGIQQLGAGKGEVVLARCGGAGLRLVGDVHGLVAGAVDP